MQTNNEEDSEQQVVDLQKRLAVAEGQLGWERSRGELTITELTTVELQKRLAVAEEHLFWRREWGMTPRGEKIEQRDRDAVTLDRQEYEALLRDRALAEKVRGMGLRAKLIHTLDSRWKFIPAGLLPPFQFGDTPEEAMGIEEEQNAT